MIKRKHLLLLTVLVIVSPVFGVWLAEALNYAEPLDHVAKALNLTEWEWLEWTPLKDYSIPGLPDWLGYIISGFIGLAAVIALGYLLKLYVSRK